MRTLTVSLLCVAALSGVAEAESFDSVAALLDHVEQSAAAREHGCDVILTRAVAVTEALERGGELPSRGEVRARQRGEEPRTWTNPYRACEVADGLAGDPRLRVRFTTAYRATSGDLRRRSHPEVRRGYVLRLSGRLRHDPAQGWTLYPTGDATSVDAGLEVVGSVGAPVRPYLTGWSRGDARRLWARCVFELEGYHFDEATRAFAGDVELETLEVGEGGRRLRVEVSHALPHGTSLLRVRRGDVAGGGSMRVVYNRIPELTSVSPDVVDASGVVTVEGRHLLSFDGTGAIGLQRRRPDVWIGVEPATLLEVTAERIVLRVPPKAQTGRLTIRTAGGGASRALTIEGLSPMLSSVTVTEGGRLLLEGARLSRRPNHVFLERGKRLRVVSSANAALLVELPEGVTHGEVWVEEHGGGRSNAVAFRLPRQRSRGLSGAVHPR